jgi:hypothetical protein
MSKEPGTDGTSSKAASWDKLKPGSLKDLGVKIARIGASTARLG